MAEASWSRPEGFADLNPRQLYHFEITAEMGSAVAACRYLGIGAPALAKSIARLESELDTVLFDRTTRPARLTAAGEHLLQYVRRMAVEKELLQERLAMERGQRGGTMRIGCGPRWMVDIIPRAVENFIRDFPDVRISFVVDQMGRLTDLLENREIGLMFGTVETLRSNSRHEVIEMSADRFTVVARSSHPLQRRPALSLRELASERWIVSDPGSTSTTILRQLLRQADLPPILPAIELSDTLAVAAMLRRTDCLGIVSSSTVRNLEEIEALSLDFELPESRSGVIYARERTLSEPERAFIEHVKLAFA